MADQGGEFVVKLHELQLDIVQDASDEMAHTGDADLVAVLQNSCRPSRTPMKKGKREFCK